MKDRLNKLIKDYDEKRKAIEDDQNRVLNELLLQTKIRINDEFATKDLMSFEVYDQFFNQIYKDLLVEQEKFNEFSKQLLTIKRKEFIKELELILKAEDENTTKSNEIVERVMDKSINNLEKTLFNVDDSNQEIESDQVSTAELEDLLMEIRKNFNE